MTKEDEARESDIRADAAAGTAECGDHECVHASCENAFLLRLLDESRADGKSWRRVAERLQAKVAALTAAGNALLSKHEHGCDCGPPWKAACGAVTGWINAILAEAVNAEIRVDHFAKCPTCGAYREQCPNCADAFHAPALCRAKSPDAQRYCTREPGHSGLHTEGQFVAWPAETVKP